MAELHAELTEWSWGLKSIELELAEHWFGLINEIQIIGSTVRVGDELVH